ncbi:hypothetical protein Csa_017518 [Cucumis sativus]|uniref:Uncharacterized protein n=1 Tax=Cucumis sativus TaxID=3659 RepID=A0A0A0L8J5_CUCSA|nr:hypothetical protein Csa_017518 [Cucumis sativus]
MDLSTLEHVSSSFVLLCSKNWKQACDVVFRVSVVYRGSGSGSGRDIATFTLVLLTYQTVSSLLIIHLISNFV